MKETNIETKKRKLRIKPVFIIMISFIGLIFLGAIFLYCPFSLNDNVHISFLDALFTSVTSTTVTGLVSLPQGIASTFNIVGRTIICILIQLGGLGAATLTVFIFLIASRKLSLSEQTLIKEAWNLRNYKSIKQIFYYILLITFSVEIIGMFFSFLDFRFIQHFDAAESFGYAFFHAISSFNNAGIDLFGTTSLIKYQRDAYLNILTALLIIIGGLGYFSIIDIVANKFNFKKFSLHTKIVTTYSFVLIIFGWLMIYLCELVNKGTDVSGIGSFFLSVSTRTAGFTTYDLSKFNYGTILIMIVLMFVGASPGGTGGGIKTTAIAILFAYIRGVMTSKKPHLYKRSLSDDLFKRALLVISLGGILFITGTILICLFEGDYNYIKDGVKYTEYVEGASRFSSLDIAFDTMSAFATVGLSTGITPYLGSGSKVVLMIIMYIGRIGPLTVSTVFKPNNKQHVFFVEEDVSIG